VGELTLTETADGGRFRVRAGDVVTLHLPENAAGGYAWTVAEADEARVDVVRRRYESTSPAVGSAGVAVWTITAKSAGTARIALKKLRPWEPSSAGAGTFTITLDVVNRESA